MKRILSILMLFFVLFACQNPKSKIKKLITGENYKYWIWYKDYPYNEYAVHYNWGNQITFYRFDSNGQYDVYIKSGIFEQLTKNSDYKNNTDMVYDYLWSLTNDTVISIDNRENIIKYLSEEFMILKCPIDNSISIFICVQDTILLQNLDRIK
jgi:hypothetical protein